MRYNIVTRKEQNKPQKERKKMKEFRIKGTWYTVKANCIRQALKKLVDEDGDFTYTPHWYTRSNRKSWAEFETSYGYRGIVEEV
jgi:hypothetical protein